MVIVRMSILFRSVTKYLWYFRLYPKKGEVKQLTHYAAPGRITFEEAEKGSYSNTTVGQEFGPTYVLIIINLNRFLTSNTCQF